MKTIKNLLLTVGVGVALGCSAFGQSVQTVGPSPVNYASHYLITNMPTFLATNTPSTNVNFTRPIPLSAYTNGMTIWWSFVGTNATSSGSVKQILEVSPDNSTWSSDTQFTFTGTVNGTNPVVAKTNVPASFFVNANWWRLRYTTNATTNRVNFTKNTYSFTK